MEWATGDNAAPIWLDVAREYMERYVHQLQIREAVGAGPLSPQHAAPVLKAAAHALPVALASVRRPPGTVVSFSASGDDGGSWYLTSAESGWDLSAARPAGPVACAVRTTVAGAVKRYVRDPPAPPLVWDGDAELAAAVAQVKAGSAEPASRTGRRPPDGWAGRARVRRCREPGSWSRSRSADYRAARRPRLPWP